MKTDASELGPAKKAIMEPPDGFVERAVDRALEVVVAEEAAGTPVPSESPIDDEITQVDAMADPHQQDSGVFELGDDGPPTIPYLRADGT